MGGTRNDAHEGARRGTRQPNAVGNHRLAAFAPVSMSGAACLRTRLRNAACRRCVDACPWRRSRSARRGSNSPAGAVRVAAAARPPARWVRFPSTASSAWRSRSTRRAPIPSSSTACGKACRAHARRKFACLAWAGCREVRCSRCARGCRNARWSSPTTGNVPPATAAARSTRLLRRCKSWSSSCAKPACRTSDCPAYRRVMSGHGGAAIHPATTRCSRVAACGAAFSPRPPSRHSSRC